MESAHQFGTSGKSCASDEIVDVCDRQMQGHRAPDPDLGSRALQLGVSIRHHQVRSMNVELGVTYPTIRHLDRIERHSRVEDLAVPSIADRASATAR